MTNCVQNNIAPPFFLRASSSQWSPYSTSALSAMMPEHGGSHFASILCWKISSSAIGFWCTEEGSYLTPQHPAIVWFPHEDTYTQCIQPISPTSITVTRTSRGVFYPPVGIGQAHKEHSQRLMHDHSSKIQICFPLLIHATKYFVHTFAWRFFQVAIHLTH